MTALVPHRGAVTGLAVHLLPEEPPDSSQDLPPSSRNQEWTRGPLASVARSAWPPVRL